MAKMSKTKSRKRKMPKIEMSKKMSKCKRIEKIEIFVFRMQKNHYSCFIVKALNHRRNNEDKMLRLKIKQQSCIYIKFVTIFYFPQDTTIQ